MLGYLRNFKLKTLLCFVIINIVLYIFIQGLLYNGMFRNELPLRVLVWWTPFMPDRDRIINCNNGKETCKCLVTSNHNYNANLGAYLFYGSQIENRSLPLPRDGNIPWAVFHEESPKNYAPFLYEETQSLFNITSTFSRNSDFAITLQYLPDLKLITDKTHFVPLEMKNKYLKNISPVLYLQSDCDTPISRDDIVEELQKFIKIDSYGKCLKNKNFPKELSKIYPLDLYNRDILNFLAKYKFIIALENAICDDYITEKLWRSLIVGSIPIYLGSPTIEDWLPNNNSAILIKNFSDLKSVAEYILEINNNNTLYDSFLEHKLFSKISNTLLQENVLNDHPISAFECFVCGRVHKHSYNYRTRKGSVYNCPKPVVEKSKNNTWNQHWEIGMCQSKALKLLVENGTPYSSQIYEDTWKFLLYNKKCT